MNFDFKNECKNDLKDNNENVVGDTEKGFLAKLILKPYDRTAAILTAWEVK